MASIDYEGSRDFLMQAGPDGVSLYEHLSEVLLKVISERPGDALAMFEHMSATVKRSTFKAPQRKDGEQEDQEHAAASLRAAQKQWAARCHRYFKKSGGADGEEEAEEEEGEGEGEPVQDLPNELEALEWAGVGLSREEGFRLYLSMKKLARKTRVSGLRFWGKLLGRHKDYLVLEGEMRDEEEPEAEEGKEGEVEGRAGGNKYTYFVCNAVGEEWVRLPRLAPGHVVVARKLRRFLTGDLGAAVPGHPPFRGTEANLLRATIARITAGTLLAPEGLFAVPDEEGAPYAIEPAEEPTAREQEEMRSLGAWVHLHPEINTLGRVLPVEKLNEEGEPVEDEDAPERVPALRSLEEDAEGSWQVGTCPASGGEDPNAMVVLRSQVWPGAVTVCFGKRFANLYVGYGLKQSAVPYSPEVPATVMAEYNDGEFKEQEDVTVNPEPEGAGAGEEDGEEEDE